MIKRLAATFLSLLLLMSLAACGHSSDKEQITIEQKTEENSGMEEIEDFSSYVNKDYLLNYENIVISDVTGLTLEGAEGGIVELVTENGGASVLEIWKSENVTLRGLTCGHEVERGPEAPVQVHWTELWMNEDTDYEKFVVDDGEYSVHVMFRAKRTITDFELMQMTIEEVNEDGKVSYDLKPIYSLDRLTPKRPLVVSLTFPGDTPAYGISYVDESGDGMKHQFSVEVSGEDGTLLLREIN